MSKFKKDAIMRPYYFIDQLEMEMKKVKSGEYKKILMPELY
mgnify:CR=1 FL=1